MQYSRSESALGLAHGRSGVGSAGVRLAPVSRTGAGGGAAAWQAEEKQHTVASGHGGSGSGGVGTRLVDAAGRPRDSPDPFLTMRSPASATPSATRVDAEGMPVISILSPAGLRGNEGDSTNNTQTNQNAQSHNDAPGRQAVQCNHLRHWLIFTAVVLCPLLLRRLPVSVGSAAPAGRAHLDP